MNNIFVYVSSKYIQVYEYTYYLTVFLKSFHIVNPWHRMYEAPNDWDILELITFSHSLIWCSNCAYSSVGIFKIFLEIRKTLTGNNLMHNQYLLITEFDVRTVSYGPSFQPHRFVTYRTDWENEVSKIFIISLPGVWRVRERFLFTQNGFKFLTHLES